MQNINGQWGTDATKMTVLRSHNEVIVQMFLISTMRKGRHEEGFTLIETVVTMGIAGILTAIAVVGYLGWKPGYVLRDAVSTVRGGIERAKMRAVETRKECKIEFSSDGFEIYDGEYVMNSENWGSVDSDGEFTDSDSYSSVSLDDYSDVTLTDGSCFIFSPHGFLVSEDSDDSLDVTHPTEDDVKISVYVGGNVYVEWDTDNG